MVVQKLFHNFIKPYSTGFMWQKGTDGIDFDDEEDDSETHETNAPPSSRYQNLLLKQWPKEVKFSQAFDMAKVQSEVFSKQKQATFSY